MELEDEDVVTGLTGDPPPRFARGRNSARQRLRAHSNSDSAAADPQVPDVEGIRGRVVLFTTCYGNRNTPEICEDLAAVFEHNGITVVLAAIERCCGMPKLELGDLDAVAKSKEENIPETLFSIYRKQKEELQQLKEKYGSVVNIDDLS